MKAVVATGYGPPEQFMVADVPVPRPGPGQLQVRIAAAAINPGDVRIASGEFRDSLSLEFPHVPGNDFAGTVTEAGEGVTAFAVGDEIFGLAIPRALRAMAGTHPSVSTGTLAEYAVVEADTPLLAHRPPTVSAADAAALATAGATALALMTAGEVRPGETVLVVGATGGVGTAVVPLLAAAGAHVVATATPADADLLRDLGATDTIGYTDYPADVDAALNLTVPSDRLTGIAKAVRPGGRLLTITYPVPQQEWLGEVKLRFVLDMDVEMRAVADLAAAGTLPATIGRRYVLDDGAQACVDFAREHTTGKLVVAMSGA
jgi:NADPH:quinone reductase-like Zn-dependent oxidoreductase